MGLGLSGILFMVKMGAERVGWIGVFIYEIHQNSG